jgi:hypothetical protein
MEKNVGIIDKLVRLFIAIVIAVLYYFNVISGKAEIVFSIIAVYLILSSYFSLCFFYFLLKISSTRKDKKIDKLFL